MITKGLKYTFKAAFLLAIVFGFSDSAIGQTRTWIGEVSSDWNTAANWTPSVVPGIADDVSINDPAAPNQPVISSDVSVTVNSVTINEGSLMILGNASLASQLFTQKGGSVNLSTGSSIVGPYFKTNGTLDINGASIIGSLENFDGLVNCTGVTDITGNLTVTGGDFTASSDTSIFGGNFSVGGSGFFEPNGGKVVFDAQFSNVSVGSILLLNDLEIALTGSPSNIRIPVNQTIRVNGTLTLTNGSLFDPGFIEARGPVNIADTWDGGNGNLRLAGTVVRTVSIPQISSMTGIEIDAPNTTIEFVGSGTTSFSGSVTLRNFAGFNNDARNLSFVRPFQCEGGIVGNGNNTYTFNSTFTLTGGSFVGGSGLLDLNGDFLVSGGSFTASSNISRFARNFTISGTGIFNANSGTVLFDGNSTVVDVNSTVDLHNLRVEKTFSSTLFSVAGGATIRVGNDTQFIQGTLTGTGVTEVLGNYSQGFGFFNSPELGFVRIAGNSTRTISLFGGLEYANMIFDAPNVTVTVAGSGTAIFETINIIRIGGISVGTISVNVRGSFTQSGGSYSGGSASLSVDGNFSISGGTFLNDSAVMQTGAMTLSGGSFTGPFGTLSVTSLTINNTNYFANSAITRITRNLTITGSGTFTHNGQTVEFTGPSIIDVNGAVDFHDLRLTSTFSNEYSIGSNDIVRVLGTLSLFNGQLFAANGTARVEILGNLNASGFDGGVADIRFLGSGDQSISGNALTIFPTGQYTVDKPSGTLNVSGTVNLSNGTEPLVLQNGLVESRNAVFNIGSRLIEGANGFVDGPVTRHFLAAGVQIFPVGTSTGRATLTFQANNGAFGTNTLVTISANNGILPGSASGLSLDRHWTITVSPGGINNANLTFNYLDSDVPPTANEANFAILRSTGTSTTVQGGSILAAINRASISGVTQFSDWGIGRLAPTAAAVTIGGRVMTPDGRGIGRTVVTLNGPNGVIATTITNPFGYYRFNGEAGAGYVVAVASKSHRFEQPSRTITPLDNVSDLNFVSTPNN